MKKPLPPVYLLGALTLVVLLHFLWPGGRLIAGPWRLLGIALLLIGIVLNLAADQGFKKRKTTVKPFERPTSLITGGVFGFSRNPMYLGMVSIILGVSVLLGSATPFAVVPVFAFLLDRCFIVKEEQSLQDIFGDQFRQYRNRTRRWV
jgi:protein-S-isoprenylcysteine O-methyltransferase Ste14